MLLALVIEPLITQPFRDGAPLLLRSTVVTPSGDTREKMKILFPPHTWQREEGDRKCTAEKVEHAKTHRPVPAARLRRPPPALGGGRGRDDERGK